MDVLVVHVVDAGPLIAALDRRDAYHAWAVRILGTVHSPLLTVEAVLSEACVVLAHVRGADQRLLGMVEDGLLVVEPVLASHAARARALMKRYADVPMSLADACLVVMSEIHDKSTLITLDDDFRVYRRHGRSVIPLIAPET